MALNLNNFDAALKQHYTKDEIENLVYANNPLLAMIPKMEDFGGRNLPIPIIYGNPQGRSSNFTNAQANKTNTQIKAFLLTRTHDYSLADIDNETMMATEGDENAFMEAATTEIDGALQSLGRSLATALYRDGTGQIGQISATSNVATNTITLADPTSAVNFEVGMTLVASPTANGAGVVGGTAFLTGVNRNTGTLTLAGNWNAAIASVAANYYLYVQGDPASKIKGMASWLPLVAPTPGDNFFGIDRSSDTVRLAGNVYNAIGQPLEEGIIKATAVTNREGGSPATAFMSFENWAILENQLSDRRRYNDNIKAGNFGFRSLQIQGPRNLIDVIPDQNCPANVCYLLDLNVVKFYSLGAAPQLLTYQPEGLRVLRNPSSDSVEVRCGYYGNVGFRAPGWNAVIQLA